MTYKFIAGDCYSAIGLFQDYEVDNQSVSLPSFLPPSLPHPVLHSDPCLPYSHAKTLFEFVPSDVVPSYAQFTQRTPRKYAYKSCTMAIVMLTDLQTLGLAVPRLPAGKKWARTDLSDYTAIENAILNVRDGCLSVIVSGGLGGDGDGGARKREREGVGGKKGLNFANPVGYDVAGHRGSIGVFLWDTNSVVNQVVKDAYNVLHNGGNGGNGTESVGTS